MSTVGHYSTESDGVFLVCFLGHDHQLSGGLWIVLILAIHGGVGWPIYIP